MHAHLLVPVVTVVFSMALGGAPQAPQAARSGQAIDVSRLGPQPGEKVPDFTLTGHDGRQRSLSSLMGEQGLVLVFSRTADW